MLYNKIVAFNDFQLSIIERFMFLFSGKFRHNVQVDLTEMDMVMGIHSDFGEYKFEQVKEHEVAYCPHYVDSQKLNPTGIVSFKVKLPTNEYETKGEVLKLSRFGEYCPDASLRGYKLSYLLANPNNYVPYQIVEQGISSFSDTLNF